MSARQISEDEAFRLLRSASMHAKLRIGQVSQQVIDSAHYAEAINRAGRLRMLSQRIVKLYALAAAGVEVAVGRGVEISAAATPRSSRNRGTMTSETTTANASTTRPITVFWLVLTLEA